MAHERTTSDPSAERQSLMQACHTRTSPLPRTIWRSRKDKKTNPRLLFDRSPPPTQNQKKNHANCHTSPPLTHWPPRQNYNLIFVKDLRRQPISAGNYKTLPAACQSPTPTIPVHRPLAWLMAAASRTCWMPTPAPRAPFQ